MITELKTCPVCGGKAITTSYHWDITPTYWLDEYHVECVNCGLSTYAYSTEQEAINAWNTRVKE